MPTCASGTTRAAPSDCVGCHDQVTPLAVTDWRSSRHAQEGIGCEACHKGNHRSARDVASLTIVTAQTCGGCHERQMLEFTAGKHSRAWAAAKALPTAHALPMAMGPAAADCGACHKIGLDYVSCSPFRVPIARLAAAQIAVSSPR